jgi:flagellar protein FlbD
MGQSEMIRLTRLNGQPVFLNSDLIKLVENAPDTLITLVNGEKVIVRETVEQIIDRIVGFRRRLFDSLRTNQPGFTRQGEGPDVISFETRPFEAI